MSDSNVMMKFFIRLKLSAHRALTPVGHCPKLERCSWTNRLSKGTRDVSGGARHFESKFAPA